MAKSNSRFVCQNCGAISISFMGRCPECDEWNTYIEEKIETGAKAKAKTAVSVKEPIAIKDVKSDTCVRVSSEIPELDLVLGSGIVHGSLVLVGGDPGIGKSTLLLQMATNLSLKHKVLYVSGEESLSQIKIRADRLSEKECNVLLLAECEMKSIFESVMNVKPDYLIIDSIQTMYNDEISAAPGSVSQVREITHQLMLLSKQMGIGVFIIGHVTKSGNIAGPKVLEHMVDTVLYFEGDQNSIFRILRAVKNRFGSTNEIGIFEMTQLGLIGVSNPSKLFIDNKPKNTSGSVITISMEGSRPILLEVQALTSLTTYPSPRRLSIGVDYNKLNILLAVMEKICGINLMGLDVYVNLVGGMIVTEPSIDLSIACAVRSINLNKPVDDDLVIFGEIGLTGEIRGVSNANRRVAEAVRLGYKKIMMPKSNVNDEILKMGAEIVGVASLNEAFRKTSN